MRAVFPRFLGLPARCAGAKMAEATGCVSVRSLRSTARRTTALVQLVPFGVRPS